MRFRTKLNMTGVDSQGQVLFLLHFTMNKYCDQQVVLAAPLPFLFDRYTSCLICFADILYDFSQLKEGKEFAILTNWRRSCSIKDVLQEIRKNMGSSSNKKLSQPAEGSFY